MNALTNFREPEIIRTAKTLKTSFKNIKLAIFFVKDLRNDSIVMLTMSLKSFGYILKKKSQKGAIQLNRCFFTSPPESGLSEFDCSLVAFFWTDSIEAISLILHGFHTVAQNSR